MEDLIKKLQTKRLSEDNSQNQLIPQKQLDINTLVEWGTRGHFPLFYPEWIKSYALITGPKSKREIKKEQKLFKDISKKINKYKQLDRKRTLLMSLPEEQRVVFVSRFMSMVETKILDLRPDIH